MVSSIPICNIKTNKREITSGAAGVTAPTTSGDLVNKRDTRHKQQVFVFPLSLIIIHPNDSPW